MDFPTDTDYITLPNTEEWIKQQSIDENILLIETELKKNERGFETLENLVNDAKRDLIKIFIDPSDGMTVDNIINVNEWVDKADEKKQQLVQHTQQNYNEIAGKMIRANNADLLSQMISNNEIRD